MSMSASNEGLYKLTINNSRDVRLTDEALSEVLTLNADIDIGQKLPTLNT